MAERYVDEEDCDYYTILDIAKTSTSAEIKKAYRKQALKWHPDKNLENKEQAEKKFKLIAEAYEVLSDKEKKKIYDKYGKQGLVGESSSNGGDSAYFTSHHGFHPFYHFRDPMDIFHEFFGDDPFADIFGFRPHGHHRDRSGRNAHRSTTTQMNPFQGFSMFSPFNGFSGFGGDDFFSHDGFGGSTSFSMSSSSFGMGGGPGMRSTSTSRSTRMVNGKTVTTTKVVDNGVETVTVEENGVLTSHKVNGKEQLERLEYTPQAKGDITTHPSKSRGHKK